MERDSPPCFLSIFLKYNQKLTNHAINFQIVDVTKKSIGVRHFTGAAPGLMSFILFFEFIEFICFL